MNRSLIIALTSVALTSMIAQVPVFAQHAGHEEYEQYDNDNEYSSEGKLQVNYKVIVPPVDGHLSTCIKAPGFEFCNEKSGVGSDRVIIGDMTTGVYHIPEGDKFQLCSTFYPTGSSKIYNACQDMTNHENDHPEYAEIKLTTSVCA